MLLHPDILFVESSRKEQCVCSKLVYLSVVACKISCISAHWNKIDHALHTMLVFNQVIQRQMTNASN